MAPPAPLHRSIALACAAASLACAPAPREGETVHIAEESAIIIWDAASKTQHFIRRASFETKAKDFGFLVPTPTVPKFEEADDEAFEHLYTVTAPKPDPTIAVAKGEAPRKAATVAVVATAKVAGYDAVVLEASDAEALNRWLKENGYASSPELVGWFKPYIEKKWRISAFKVAAGAAAGGTLETKAVRMSFQTEQPFFPYREPEAAGKAAAPGSSRLLRVYFLGEGRVGGAIGTGGAWPGQAVWSNSIAGDRNRLMELVKLPPAEAAGATWLTVFEDRSSPRPGTDDLFFVPSSDQSAMAAQSSAASEKRAADRAAKRRSNLILLIIFIVIGLLGAFIAWRVSRRR